MCPITAGGAGPALDSSLRPGPLAHPRASWRGPAARVRVSQSNLVSHKESRFLMTAGSDSVALTCSRPLSSSQSLTAKGGGNWHAGALSHGRAQATAVYKAVKTLVRSSCRHCGSSGNGLFRTWAGTTCCLLFLPSPVFAKLQRRARYTGT